MDATQVIYTELTQCQDCYKCLRECPVKAIQIVENHARVMAERCIHCGHCVEVCPRKAKKVRSDLEKAKVLMRLRPKVALSLAPSFAAEFTGLPLPKLIAGCRALGFCAVSETSLGADLVSLGLGNYIAKNRPELLISSACPAVVQFIRKYLPEMNGNLSSSCSPMVAHGRYLKRTLGAGCAVVFAGPCIAKKWESDVSEGAIDVAITFRELRAWFEEEKIDFDALEPAPDDRLFPRRAERGALYPIEGGMVASLKHAGVRDTHCMTFSGVQQIKDALKGVAEQAFDGELAGRKAGCGPGLPAEDGSTLFLELLACEGGCVNGPQTGEMAAGTVAKRLRVLSYVAAREGPGGIEENPGEDKEAGAATVLGETPVPDLSAILAAPVATHEAAVTTEAVSDDRLRIALASIGKYSHKDELNCAGCGYDSCRAFATAMLLGKAEKTMCVSYMRNLAQKKANALLATMPSAAVVVDSSLKIVESNKPFADLLGPDAAVIREVKPTLEGADLRKFLPFWQAFEQVLSPGKADLISSDFRAGDRIFHGSVFSIEKGLLAGGLFQDITDPWIQKDRVIQQAKKVMNQNLKTVQKIAYLLGENAADSEAALTSIIDSFQGKNPGDTFSPDREDAP